MNQDELERRLADMPAETQRAPAPKSESTSLAETMRGLLSAVARTPVPGPDVEAARAQARADALAAHRKRVAARRTELQWRISSPLLGAIRERQTPCALILGPTGCGKTSAAQWLKAGLPGEWFHARDLAGCERRHALGDGEPPALTRACATRVLYIDDLGTEEARDIAVLQQVYERRYSAGLATVTTTGLTKPMLTERYGAATVRRMRDQHVVRSDGSEWPVLVFDLHEVGL